MFTCKLYTARSLDGWTLCKWYMVTLHSQCVFTCKHKLAARSRDGRRCKGYSQTDISMPVSLFINICKHLNLQLVEMDVILVAQIDASLCVCVCGGGGGGLNLII